MELDILNNELENGFINHAEKLFTSQTLIYSRKVATKISLTVKVTTFAEQMANRMVTMKFIKLME